MELTWERFCWIAFAVALALAAVGVAWYALTPGIVSYQASSLLTFPALLIVLVWLHRRLPMRLQWVLAWALVPVGPVGYLVFGGAHWWNWGQFAPVPLLLLLTTRPGAWNDSSGTGAIGMDGPWGPP